MVKENGECKKKDTIEVWVVAYNHIGRPNNLDDIGSVYVRTPAAAGVPPIYPHYRNERVVLTGDLAILYQEVFVRLPSLVFVRIENEIARAAYALGRRLAGRKTVYLRNKKEKKAEEAAAKLVDHLNKSFGCI